MPTVKEKEIKGRPFFCQEDWEEALIKCAEDKGYKVREVLIRSKSILVGYDSVKIEPMPIFMQEWIENHPMPTMRRNEFIHSLGMRVAALEAALAKKGGLQ